MTTAAIRTKLHDFIDNAADKKVKAMYTMFEENIEAEEEYTPEFKAELDREYEDYKNDGITISREEVNAAVKERLKKFK